MTVIIDPLGTPEPVYTRSGTTMQTILANGSTQGDATPITAVSGLTVVTAVISNEFFEPNTELPVPQRAVKLPDDAQIGDVVEIHVGIADGHESEAQLLVFPASGDTISKLPANSSVPVNQIISAASFRKMTATNWKA